MRAWPLGRMVYAEARRACGWTAGLSLALAACGAWLATAQTMERVSGLIPTSASAALERHGAWCAVLLVLCPCWSWLAAVRGDALRTKERTLWLVGGADAWQASVSQVLGLCTVALASVVLLALMIEWRAGAATLPRELGPAVAPQGVWIDHQGLTWSASVPAPSHATTLCVPLGLGSGAGAATRVEFSVSSLGSTRRSESLIALQGDACVAWPTDTSDTLDTGTTLQLRTMEPAARVWLMEGAHWQAAPEPASTASVELALRTLLLLAVLAAWAHGLAMWMRPALAAVVALLTWGAIAFAWSPAWLAGAQLPEALYTLRAGSIPIAIDAWSVADALAGALVGLVLSVRGLARGAAA